jgi:HSP20 family protein
MPRHMVPWERSGSLLDLPTPRVFDNLRQEMNQLFSEFFGGEDGGERMALVPRLNVAETDTAYEISLDVPGMKAEEFAIELKDGRLWITGERKQEEEQQGKTYHRIERAYGEFRRVVPLEENVEESKILAEYKDGVLKIALPKTEKARPKKIPVKAE